MTTASMTLCAAIARVRPGAICSVPNMDAPTLSDVVWDDPEQAITQAQLDAAMAATIVDQALAEARAARTLFFARFDGLQASAIATGNTALALEIEGAKTAMRSITADVDLSGCATLPQMRVAILNRWKAIRAPLSSQLKAAFSALDQ